MSVSITIQTHGWAELRNGISNVNAITVWPAPENDFIIGVLNSKGVHTRGGIVIPREALVNLAHAILASPTINPNK